MAASRRVAVYASPVALDKLLSNGNPQGHVFSTGFFTLGSKGRSGNVSPKGTTGSCDAPRAVRNHWSGAFAGLECLAESESQTINARGELA